MEPMAIPTIVVTLVIALVGFLLKRSIDDNDRNQQATKTELKAAIDSGLREIRSELNSLKDKANGYSESIVELRVRIGALERDMLNAQRNFMRHRQEDDEAPP